MITRARPAGARLAEGVAALLLAGALHLLAVAAIMPQLAAGEGNGAPKIVVAAAPEAWARLAAAWEAAPIVAAAPEGPPPDAPVAGAALSEALAEGDAPWLPPPPEVAIPAAPTVGPSLPLAPPRLSRPAPPEMPQTAAPSPATVAPVPRDARATDRPPETPPETPPAPPRRAPAPAGPGPEQPDRPAPPTQTAPSPVPTPSQPARASQEARADARSDAERRWQAETRRRIEEALRLPRGARARGARVEIGFEVDADGGLVSVRITAASGQPALDAAAVAAVRAAAPFAPPPEGPTGARFTINLGR